MDLEIIRKRCIRSGDHGTKIYINNNNITMCGVCHLILHWKGCK